MQILADTIVKINCPDTKGKSCHCFSSLERTSDGFSGALMGLEKLARFMWVFMWAEKKSQCRNLITFFHG